MTHSKATRLLQKRHDSFKSDTTPSKATRLSLSDPLVVEAQPILPLLLRYQLPKGTSVGLALKYCSMMHNVGRCCTADPTSGDPVLKLFPEVEGEARRSLLQNIVSFIGLFCKEDL